MTELKQSNPNKVYLDIAYNLIFEVEWNINKFIIKTTSCHNTNLECSLNDHSFGKGDFLKKNIDNYTKSIQFDKDPKFDHNYKRISRLVRLP